MFRKKCTLCGSKLDGNGICTECGLDNKKSDANYRLNQSRCDDMPMMHVHKEKKDDRKFMQQFEKQEVPRLEKKAKPAKQRRTKKKPGCVSVFLILVVLFNIVPYIFEVIDNEVSTENTYNSEEIDPYEYVDAELPEEGKSVSYELTSGDYIVGIHIPEGYYKARIDYDYDAIQVSDSANEIYLYEYRGKEGTNYLDDLRLFNGAILTISTETSITISSDNAQVSSMQGGMENPLTDPVNIKGGKEMTAGVDFEAGVYDVTAYEDFVYAQVIIYDEDGEVYYSKDIYVGTGASDGEQFKNLVIPEGATITCEEGKEIDLEPSETIQSTDYQKYYNYY